MIKNQRKTGILLSYITLVANSLVGIIYTPFMTSTLGKAEYGIYQLVASFSAYLMLVDFGTGTTVTRYLSKFRAEKDPRGEENFLAMMIIQTAVLSLIAVSVGCGLYFSLDAMFTESLSVTELITFKKLFVLMIANVGVSLFDHVWQGICTADERFVYTNGMKLIRIFLRMGLITVLLLSGMGSIALLLVDLSLSVIFLALDILVAFRVVKVRIHFYCFDKPLFKETFLFASFILLQALINQLTTNAPKTVLGILMNPEAVAVYAVAMQIFVIYNTLSSTVSSVFLPKATRMVYSGADNTQLTDFVIIPGRFQFMILGIALAGFTLLGQDFILLWMSEEYRSAWLIALIVMVSSTIELVESVTTSIVLAKNKNGFRTGVMACISVLCVLLSVWLISAIGELGAPIATAVAYVVGYIIVLNIYYQKVIGLQVIRMFKEIFKGILPAVLLSLLLTIPIHLWLNTVSWTNFLLKAMYMIVVYVGCMLLFGMNASEKQTVRNLLSKICGKGNK